MNKRYYIFTFLLLIMVIASCKKKKRDVTIHGRVLYSCNQQPVQNIPIEIYAHWGTESSGVGSGSTNNDGYYSIQGEVASVDRYVLGGGGAGVGVSGGTTNVSGSDIVIDATASKAVELLFHIKNINPINSSDYFHDLEMLMSYGSFRQLQEQPISLFGQNVDTTFSMSMGEDSSFTFRYTVRKNSISSDYSHTVVVTTCFTPINVDLFY